MFLSFAYLAFSAVLKLLVGRRRNKFGAPSNEIEQLGGNRSQRRSHDTRTKRGAICWPFVKPSDGLEPSRWSEWVGPTARASKLLRCCSATLKIGRRSSASAVGECDGDWELACPFGFTRNG
jgi:hypothetical protein